MLSPQRLVFSRSRQGSASSARQRLLSDPTLRHARAPRAVEHPFARPAAPAVTLPTSTIPASDHLSPAEQRQVVHQIATGFNAHYLGHITYLEQQAITVATLLPRCPTRPAAGEPQRISVDHGGNVSVSYHPFTPARPATPLVPRPMAYTRGVALALLVISIFAVACLL